MEVNRENLATFYQALLGRYNQQLSESDAPLVWPKIAEMIRSSTAVTIHAWHSRFPQMSEWFGEAAREQLRGYEYPIRNRTFRGDVTIKRSDLEDDQVGLAANIVAGAAEAAREWPDVLMAELVNNAFTTPCYDGKPFFAADHPFAGDEPWSNLLTVPLSADSLGDAVGSFGAARRIMRQAKDDQGRPFRAMPAVLLVPPALYEAAHILMTAKTLKDDAPNPYMGAAAVCEWDRLTSDTAWQLLGSRGMLKPYVFQERIAAGADELMMGPDAWSREDWEFGSRGRGNAGFGLPQLAVGSTGTG